MSALLSFLLFGLALISLIGIVFLLLPWMYSWLFKGLIPIQVDKDRRLNPNQGIIASGWNALRLSLIPTLAVGLFIGLAAGLKWGLPTGLAFGLFAGLAFGLLAGLSIGTLQSHFFSTRWERESIVLKN